MRGWKVYPYMTVSPDPNLPENLPENLPTMGIPHNLLGDGWAPVAVGEHVKSHYQLYAFFIARPGWVLSSFLTSDGYKNNGRQTYRKPISLRAYLSIIVPLVRKYLRRWFKGDGKPISS